MSAGCPHGGRRSRRRSAVHVGRDVDQGVRHAPEPDPATQPVASMTAQRRIPWHRLRALFRHSQPVRHHRPRRNQHRRSRKTRTGSLRPRGGNTTPRTPRREPVNHGPSVSAASIRFSDAGDNWSASHSETSYRLCSRFRRRTMGARWSATDPISRSRSASLGREESRRVQHHSPRRGPLRWTTASSHVACL